MSDPSIVKPEDERTANRGTGCCTYCQQPIGSQHKVDCVAWRKRVMVRATIEYPVTVPNCWDKEDIEFNRNEGSWCAGNLTDELEKGPECLCWHTKFKYLREATTDDIEAWEGE